MKHRRLLWIGIGALFLLAVGSGYIPDLLLIRQMGQARAEGLVQPLEKVPSAPRTDDARLAYIEALKAEQTGIGALRAHPANESARPTEFVRNLLNLVAEASKKPYYAEPRQTVSEDPAVRYAMPTMINLEPDLVLVGRALAGSAKDEERLLAAARLARHLRNDDPVTVPRPCWATVAGYVLDGADRLRLPADARARVVAALGPKPEPVALVKRHVSAVLARLETDPGISRSSSFIRSKVRFLVYWRGFLRKAPKEPEAFARFVKSQAAEMDATDAAVGANMMANRYFAAPTPQGWSEWAEAMAMTLKRL